jgi:hypothetical protein
MKRVIASAVLVFLAVITKAQEINDPNAEVRKVGSFHAIKVSNAIDLYLSQSDAEAVAVSAVTPEYRDRIKTVVENGVLKISYDNELSWKSGNKKLKAYVSFKNLDELYASGASDVTVAGTIKVNKLSVEMNGASDLKGKLEINTLDLKLNGASDATISGKVVNLKIDANGASDLKGYDLETDNCTAEASGASDIKITVNKELSAKASGASGVHYRGSGVIRDVKTSGASNISRRG